VPRVKICTSLVMAVTASFAACSDGRDPAAKDRERAPSGGGSSGPAVPDGGVREGHGVDDQAPPRERGSIVVPETDATPPQPVVRLARARATLDQGAPRVRVARNAPVVVTVVGRDRDGGMGRARVALRARLTCRLPDGGLVTRALVRYVPPPQVERIRLTPGTRTRTELIQTVTHRFENATCQGGALERFSGEVWADTTNASGLDATSKHIHFASR